MKSEEDEENIIKKNDIDNVDCEDYDDIDNDFIEVDDIDDDFVVITELQPKEVEVEVKKKHKRKPKLIGKHSLPFDTIFKGKQNPGIEDETESEHIIKNAGGTLDISDDFLVLDSNKSDIEQYRDERLKNEIRRLLLEFTDIDFNAPRRKPSESDFNAYFNMILSDLNEFGYTHTEIFIELSGYFSDNLWNIFKLLNNKYSNMIIDELKQKYGLKSIDTLNFF